MAEFTKGPWEWSTSNSIKRLSTKEKDGGVMYAYRCKDGVSDIAVSQADMALIAEAPNMYEALKATGADKETIRLGCDECGGLESDCFDECWVRLARAALAKVEGKS